MPSDPTKIFKHCFLAAKVDGKYVDTISGQRDDSDNDECPHNDPLIFADKDWDLDHLNKGDVKMETHPFGIKQGSNPCDWWKCACEAANTVSGITHYDQNTTNSNWFLAQVIKNCGGRADFPMSASGAFIDPGYPLIGPLLPY